MPVSVASGRFRRGDGQPTCFAKNAKAKSMMAADDFDASFPGGVAALSIGVVTSISVPQLARAAGIVGGDHLAPIDWARWCRRSNYRGAERSSSGA